MEECVEDGTIHGFRICSRFPPVLSFLGGAIWRLGISSKWQFNRKYDDLPMDFGPLVAKLKTNQIHEIHGMIAAPVSPCFSKSSRFPTVPNLGGCSGSDGFQWQLHDHSKPGWCWKLHGSLNIYHEYWGYWSIITTKKRLISIYDAYFIATLVWFYMILLNNYLSAVVVWGYENDQSTGTQPAIEIPCLGWTSWALGIVASVKLSLTAIQQAVLRRVISHLYLRENSDVFSGVGLKHNPVKV